MAFKHRGARALSPATEDCLISWSGYVAWPGNDRPGVADTGAARRRSDARRGRPPGRADLREDGSVAPDGYGLTPVSTRISSGRRRSRREPGSALGDDVGARPRVQLEADVDEAGEGEGPARTTTAVRLPYRFAPGPALTLRHLGRRVPQHVRGFPERERLAEVPRRRPTLPQQEGPAPLDAGGRRGGGRLQDLDEVVVGELDAAERPRPRRYESNQVPARRSASGSARRSRRNRRAPPRPCSPRRGPAD